MFGLDRAPKVRLARIAAFANRCERETHFLSKASHALDFETPTERRIEVSLYKRGNVFWSYVWVDGIRHARSTDTGNRRLAEQIDQKHKEELRLRNTLCPELAPDMK